MSDYLTKNQSDLLQMSNCVKTNLDTAPIPIKSPRNRRWQKPSSTENLLTNCEDDDAFLSGETSSEFCYKKLRNSATQTPPLKSLFEDQGNYSRFQRRLVEVDYRRSNFSDRVSSSRDIEFEKFLSNQQSDCYDDTKYQKHSESQGSWRNYVDQKNYSSDLNQHSKPIKIDPEFGDLDEFESTETSGMSTKRLEPFSGSSSLIGGHLDQRRYFSNPGNKMKQIPEQGIRNFDEFEHSMKTWGMSSEPLSESVPLALGGHLNQRRFSNPGNKINLTPEQPFQTYNEFKKSKSVKSWGMLPEDDSFSMNPSSQRRYSNPYSQMKLIPERGDRSFDEFLDQRRTTDWKEMGKELRHIADDLKLSPLNSKKSESLWRLVYRSFIGNSLEPNRKRSQSSGSLPRRK